MTGIPFIEPFFVPDVFAHRLVATEEVGKDLFRFVFAVEQTCGLDGKPEHVVVCKLVIPRGHAVENMRAAEKAMARRNVMIVR